MTNVHRIIIRSHEEGYVEPPEDVLTLGLVDNILFLGVGSYEEGFADGFEFSRVTEIKTIGIKLQDLANAITAFGVYLVTNKSVNNG